MLNNPRSAERDNQNGLRKFPFADCASCTNGKCTIVPGAIIDAQLYIPGRTPGKVWLSSIDTDGRLIFSDVEGEFAKTISPIVANAAVTVSFTGDGGPLPGGVVVFGNEDDTAALRALGGQEFTEDQTELAPAALAWPGLPGVSGFRLDDGHVVYGAVRIRGTNGCEVSTYVEDGVSLLRISAIGETVETIETTGFITKVIADSDNKNFVLSKTRSDHVIDILATGVNTLQDAGLNADQENVCSAVKRARGTTPNTVSASSVECDPCAADIKLAHKITFKDGFDTIGEDMVLFEGNPLGILAPYNIPDAARRPGWKFAGYFDKSESASEIEKRDMRLYFKFNGIGVGAFKAKTDVTLYAHWIHGTSHEEVTFDGYGTLHLAAPDLLTYANPIRISGDATPVPVIKETADDALVTGGGELASDMLLHPSVPSGTVTIGIRGLDKAYTT